MAEKLVSLKKNGGGGNSGQQGAMGEIAVTANTEHTIDTGLDEINFFYMFSFTGASEWALGVMTEFDQTFGAGHFPANTKQISFQGATSFDFVPAPVPCNSAPSSSTFGVLYSPWIKSINGGVVTIVGGNWGRTYKWKAL